MTDIRTELRVMPSSLNDACRTIDALVKALAALEEANDKLASLRSQEMYLAMLDAGQEFALADLQDARNEAQRLLAAVGGALRQGERS